jgi:hypothetical protein
MEDLEIARAGLMRSPALAITDYSLFTYSPIDLFT